MADIFLSYSSQDRDRARLFAEAFEAEGLGVWWDAALRTGETFDEAIEEALRAAKAVVVLWSPASVKSRWVRAEATLADRQGTLAPVMIEPCERPIIFELKHTIDLTHWKGSIKDPAWRELVEEVRRPAAAETATARMAPAPARRRRGRWFGPAAMAGVLAGILAIVVAGVFFLRQPGGAKLDPHVTAFFGFTADAGDPAAVSMAKAATGEVFQTMTAYDLETASRAQTEGVALKDQLARAREAHARFALSGDVRRDGDKASISLRLDDVSTAKTLWEGAVPGSASDTVSLPALTGAQAARLMRCLIGNLDEYKSDDAKVMAILPRACAEVFSPTRDTVRLWQELTVLAPKSGSAWATLAWVTRPTGAANSASLADRRAAALKAVEYDPKNALARGMLAVFAIMDGKPLAEAERDLLAAIKEAPRKGLNARAALTNPISGEVALLAAAGRNREALTYAQMNVENDPINPTVRIDLALALTRVGRPAEATQVFDEMNARSAIQAAWEGWVQAAAFNGLGGTQKAIEAAPTSVSKDSIACWKDITAGASIPAARPNAVTRLRQCIASRSIQRPVPTTPSFLGDQDLAFQGTEQVISNGAAAMIGIAPYLFDPGAKAMRADPRFTPLMEKFGLMAYWRATKTRPDICETEPAPLCAALKAG